MAIINSNYRESYLVSTAVSQLLGSIIINDIDTRFIQKSVEYSPVVNLLSLVDITDVTKEIVQQPLQSDAE